MATLPEHPLSSAVRFRFDILADMREKALPGLHGAVESFRENIIGVIDLLALPYVLIDMGLDVSARLLVEAIANAEATAIGISSEERREFVDDVTHKLAKESCTDEGHREEHRTRVHGVLARICQGPRGKSSSQALLQAGLVRVWSSLESLAEDLWELSLNIGFDQLGIAAAERILGDQELQKRNVEGLLAQSIQLHVLARHGWNISGKLGTLLKVKCDFTSVHGITALSRPCSRTEGLCRNWERPKNSARLNCCDI